MCGSFVFFIRCNLHNTFGVGFFAFADRPSLVGYTDFGQVVDADGCWLQKLQAKLRPGRYFFGKQFLHQQVNVLMFGGEITAVFVQLQCW